MKLTVQDWHSRFLHQAAWTRDLRNYCYTKFSLASSRRVLDAGCGTGALLPELHQSENLRVYGLDLDLPSLRYARAVEPRACLVNADLMRTPFPDGFFDASLLHFVLLWVPEPLQCLLELRRITRPGGVILALAEPDYGGRIDYPEALIVLGLWQQESLLQQGADPQIGRKLRSLFSQAGLNLIECGVLGGQWSGRTESSNWSSEWITLENDLEYLQSRPSAERIAELRQMDQKARQDEARILFVPTFYASGIVP